MKFNEIQDLIKLVSRSNVNEVEIEQNDTKITIRSDGASKRKKKGQKEEEEEKKNSWDQMPPFPMMYPMPQMGAPQPMQAPQPQQQPEAPQPAPASGGQQQQKEEKAEESSGEDANYVTVRSPMIGTFYRASSPEKDPFVSVGDTVKEGDVLCIIEAMKLFNEIEAEQGGKIVKVLVDDASPVEYDQPLFLLDPS